MDNSLEATLRHHPWLAALLHLVVLVADNCIWHCQWRLVCQVVEWTYECSLGDAIPAVGKYHMTHEED